MTLTEARMTLAEVLQDEHPIPVHPLVAESIGVSILPQLGHSVSVMSRSVWSQKVYRRWIGIQSTPHVYRTSCDSCPA